MKKYNNVNLEEKDYQALTHLEYDKNDLGTLSLPITITETNIRNRKKKVKYYNNWIRKDILLYHNVWHKDNLL